MTQGTQRESPNKLQRKADLMCLTRESGPAFHSGSCQHLLWGWLPLYRVTLTPLSKTKNLRYRYTYTRAHLGNHDSRDTALMCVSVSYSDIFLSYLTPSTKATWRHLLSSSYRPQLSIRSSAPYKHPLYQSSGQPWEGVPPIFQMKLRDIKELLEGSPPR